MCPTDQHLSNQAKDFKDGIFQLTKKGKQHVFNVGKFLGKKYFDFQSNNSVSVHDLEVKSIDMDRNLETATLFANGFLKETRKDGFHTIPIHSRPFANDKVS